MLLLGIAGAWLLVALLVAGLFAAVLAGSKRGPRTAAAAAPAGAAPAPPDLPQPREAVQDQPAVPTAL